jgi:hypothetical protein
MRLLEMVVVVVVLNEIRFFRKSHPSIVGIIIALQR